MATALQEFLITLKEKLNIIEVAGSYVTLDRRGGSYWACCPFHHEKTPSFCINEADQYYHCFGCGESGDVIKFVRELENIDFMDAVKMLAERAGLQIPQSGFDNQKTTELKRKRDTLLKIMNDCAHFYLDNLNSGNADEHIAYILKRKIPSNIVRTFGLGASLNFTDLPKFLLSKGYDRQDMIDSGTVNEVDGKLSDAQGGRLIYPVINAMDEVIAFGGRVLKKTNFAKYKNTKDTLIFNKSKNLYNINLLKKLRKTQTIKEVIMVEGYMDTISLYQAGFKNVVASMEVIYRYIRSLCAGITNITNIFRPDLVLLSGSLFSKNEYLLEEIHSFIEKECFGRYGTGVPDIKAVNDSENAGLTGAANLI